jgi:hypothetical protein
MSEETKTEQQAAPSKEEIMAFMMEQIEVKKMQVELQKLNTELAVQKAEELKALHFIGQITNPQPPDDAVPHTLTQEDIDENPQLSAQGLKAGDEVLVPKEMAEESAGQKRGLKKGK